MTYLKIRAMRQAASNATSHGLPYSPSPLPPPTNQGPKAPSIVEVCNARGEKRMGGFAAGLWGVR